MGFYGVRMQSDRRTFLRAAAAVIGAPAFAQDFGAASSAFAKGGATRQAPAIVTSEASRPSSAFGATAGDVDGNRAEACVRDRRKISPVDVERASPARHEQNWRRGWVSSFDDAHIYSRAKPRIRHAVSRIARGKHHAGTQTSTANGSDHWIRSTRFLCRVVFRSGRCGM